MKKLEIMLFLILLLFLTGSYHAQNATVIEKSLRVNNTEIFTKILGNGEPIVIVHGGPGLAHDYLYEPFKQLADKYKLIFYDQRGCGRSDGFKENEKVTMEMLVEDLEGIRKEFGIRRMNLVGQSWGAVIALNYIFKYSSNVKTLLLLEPSPGSSEYLPQIQQTISNRLTQPDKERLIQISQNPELRRSPGLFKEFMGIRTKTYFYDSTFLKQRHFDYFDSNSVKKFFSSSAMFGPYLMNFNLYGIMTTIKCPVLIIHGDTDIIPTASIEKMSRAIKNSELHIVKNCGHFVHIEKPDLYFNTIRAFLELYDNHSFNENVKGNYLGQKLSGDKPELFAPGIISTSFFEHSSPEFSKDGKEVYWTVIPGAPGSEAIVKYSKQENEIWSSPIIVNYLGRNDDMYPSLAFDDKRIFFSSSRVNPNDSTKKERGIWFVEKVKDGYSSPQYVGFDSLDIYGLSVTKNGNLYIILFLFMVLNLLFS